MHIKQLFELWILLCINRDSLVLFLSFLQSCSYDDLPQGQFVSELKTFVALKEQGSFVLKSLSVYFLPSGSVGLTRDTTSLYRPSV